MRAFILIVLLVFAPIFASTEAKASSGAVTGGQLYEYCNSDMGQGLCLSFITGAANMAGYIGGLFCPGDVIMHQVRQATVVYLKQNPEKHSEPAIVSFVAAMKENYPCKK